jgi:hypothetical protein
MSKHSAGSRGCPAYSQEHLDRAALAGSVTAEESGNAAGADSQIETGDGFDLSESFCEIAGFDDRARAHIAHRFEFVAAG